MTGLVYVLEKGLKKLKNEATGPEKHGFWLIYLKT